MLTSWKNLDSQLEQLARDADSVAHTDQKEIEGRLATLKEKKSQLQETTKKIVEVGGVVQHVVASQSRSGYQANDQQIRKLKTALMGGGFGKTFAGALASMIIAFEASDESADSLKCRAGVLDNPEAFQVDKI